MRVVVFALASLACASNGRKVHMSPGSQEVPDHASQQALATLLAALNPEAGWQMAGHGSAALRNVKRSTAAEPRHPAVTNFFLGRKEDEAKGIFTKKYKFPTPGKPIKNPKYYVRSFMQGAFAPDNEQGINEMDLLKDPRKYDWSKVPDYSMIRSDKGDSGFVNKNAKYDFTKDASWGKGGLALDGEMNQPGGMVQTLLALGVGAVYTAPFLAAVGWLALDTNPLLLDGIIPGWNEKYEPAILRKADLAAEEKELAAEKAQKKAEAEAEKLQAKKKAEEAAKAAQAAKEAAANKAA